MKLVRQTEMAECGLACLAMVAGHHGLEIDLAILRRLFEPSSQGMSLQAIMNAAEHIGLTPRALTLPLEELDGLLSPAILHWDLNHYVVLAKVRGGRALIFDPAGFSRWQPLSEVSAHFTGVALELRPSANFEPGEQREKLRLRQLWGQLTGFKSAFAQILVLTLIMQAFVLISPYYMQVAVDTALPALDRNLLMVLALGFGLFTLINVVAFLLRGFVLLSASMSLSFGIASNIARHLFRLPIAWFEKRHIGDVLSRFQSVDPIQKALTQGAVAALIDGILAVLILAIMFVYSAFLALLALAAFALYAMVRVISFRFERAAQEESIIERAKEQSVLIESIRGIVTLRLLGRENQRHFLWQSRLTDAINADIRLLRIGIWQQAANTLIIGCEIIFSVWLAIGLVMGGGFSLGMVFAYMAYKTLFLDRAASLIDESIKLRMQGLHLERLADIALTPRDVSFIDDRPNGPALAGRIQLQGICFRYSPYDPSLFEGLNLTIEPGEHIAISGPSGVGKSTLAKILLGLIEPDAGEVLVDGIPLRLFGHRNFHRQIAGVLQEDSLFAGSLASNIAIFDDSPRMENIEQAAKRACIDEDIVAMPMGYETLVGDMGSALSGGQKQRILIARALYREPRLILLDESTSHLDGRREQAINLAVSRMGITRIVIAHRAETIANADVEYEIVDRKLMCKRGG